MEGRMTVCGSDNLSHTAQKGRILILSDSCKAFSLEVQMKLSGILASLNLKRVQDTACTALGMDLKLMDLLRKLETEHGLLLLPIIIGTRVFLTNGIFAGKRLWAMLISE